MMDEKDIEEIIRASAPAEVFAEAFSKDNSREFGVRRDLIVVQETEDGYLAERRIDISAKVHVEGEKNDCLVHQEYTCNYEGNFKLKTSVIA